jgi:N-methylhydantoinase A
MSHQVCIDIGGTFTDALVTDASGDIRIFKAPTTP